MFNQLNLRPFYFGVPVWSSSYVDLFLSACIPSLLAAGNVPGLPDKQSSKFVIYTGIADYHRIRLSRSYTELGKLLDTRIELIDWRARHPHSVMTDCYNDLSHRCRAADAIAVFITPDLILSDGSLTYISDRMARGKQIVLIAGVRLDKEECLVELIPRYDRTTNSISFSGREMVSTMLDRLHPISRSLFWSGREFNRHPSHLYFSAGAEGFLAHCFHLHPIAARVSLMPQVSETTIDDDLACSPTWRSDEIEIIDDSDNATCFEISPKSHNVGCHGEHVADVENIVAWARNFVRSRHKEFLLHPIAFRATEPTARWKAASQMAKDVVDQISRRLEEPGPTQSGSVARVEAS